MKTARKALAALLSLGIIISLAACSVQGNDKYSVVTRLQTQRLGVAFRPGDRAGDFVIAALAVLAAEGETAKISQEWFNEDITLLKGDAAALDAFEGEITERGFIVGYDAGRMPYSGQNSAGEPQGFDIDLARAVCRLLGWKVKFLPIDVAKAETELKSGNVDCVWGGYAVNESNTNLAYSPIYMEITVVIATLSDSGIRNERALSGKTIAVSEAGQFFAALETKPEIAERAEYIIRLPGGANDCFKALEAGSCDAIVTDLAAIEYFR